MVLAFATATATAIPIVIAVGIAIGFGLASFVLAARHAQIRRTRRSAGRERESDAGRALGPARPPDATRAKPPVVACPSRRGRIPG